MFAKFKKANTPITYQQMILIYYVILKIDKSLAIVFTLVYIYSGMFYYLLWYVFTVV